MMKKTYVCTAFVLLALLFTGCQENLVDSEADVQEAPVKAATGLMGENRIPQEVKDIARRLIESDGDLSVLKQKARQPGFEIQNDDRGGSHQREQIPARFWAVNLEGPDNFYSHKAFKRGYSYETSPTLVFLLGIEGALTTEGVNGGTNPDVNEWDFFLIVGDDPAINPQTGSIWYATNTRWYNVLYPIGQEPVNALAEIDVVRMQESAGNKFTIDVDPNLWPTSTNRFSISSSPLASNYLPYTGQIVLDFSNDWETVTGSIDLIGTPSYFGYVPYEADLSGKWIGDYLLVL